MRMQAGLRTRARMYTQGSMCECTLAQMDMCSYLLNTYTNRQVPCRNQGCRLILGEEISKRRSAIKASPAASFSAPFTACDCFLMTYFVWFLYPNLFDSNSICWPFENANRFNSYPKYLVELVREEKENWYHRQRDGQHHTQNAIRTGKYKSLPKPSFEYQGPKVDGSQLGLPPVPPWRNRQKKQHACGCSL